MISSCCASQNMMFCFIEVMVLSRDIGFVVYSLTLIFG